MQRPVSHTEFVRAKADAESLVCGRSAMGLQMAFYDLPNGGFLELVAPTRPDSVLRPALDKSGP